MAVNQEMKERIAVFARELAEEMGEVDDSNANTSVLAAARLFFPATQTLGVEVDCPFTPAMLRKVSYAGGKSPSFVGATEDLTELAERTVSRERVQRWTKRVGQQCVEQAEALAEEYQMLPLPEQQKSPTDQVPQVACVMMDGGRIQVRDRQQAERDAKGYWKESLVGCCLSMVSQQWAQDPCPVIPQTFVDRERMDGLSRAIKGFSSSGEDDADPCEEPLDDRNGRPETLVKSVVATRVGKDALGRRLVAEAHSRGFQAAQRKAFVADGSATNWGVHKKHFSHYTPILDFTHAICYVYAAAMAGRGGRAGWDDYVCWAQWLWEGATDKLIAAVAGRASRLGPPPGGDETSPAAIVAKTLTYLQNQRGRMKYHQYRRLGLPITSSHIESTIKQVNRRMKGTEKFWDQGAEPLLHLVAGRLSETNRLDRFWRNRRNQLQHMRCYQTAA